MNNRARIVRGAHEVFLEQGPDAGMREVAARSGVALGTLYRHFPDKNALLEAVVQDRFRFLAQEVREVRASLPPWGAFARVMWLMAEMMTQDQALAGVIGARRHAPPPSDGPEDPRQAAVSASRKALDIELMELAQAAKAAGDLRADVNPPELAMVLAGVGMSLSMKRPGDDRPWENYLRVALDGLHSSSRGNGERWEKGEPGTTKPRQ